MRHGARSARRLARDADRLGIGALDASACLEAMGALGRAAFGEGAGILRFQASSDGGGGLHLVGLARELGPEPEAWRAVTAPFAHEGASPWAGAKWTGSLRIDGARRHAREKGVEEALLHDAEGRLVEGARSNLLVVTGDGALVTPPSERGAVAGVALEILLERVPELRRDDVLRPTLAAARELVAVNAVRGARPVVRLDGAPVGDGVPGPWAERLDAVLDAEV